MHLGRFLPTLLHKPLSFQQYRFIEKRRKEDLVAVKGTGQSGCAALGIFNALCLPGSA
jgi:hypothetical protein